MNKGHQRVSFKLLLTVGTKKKHSMKTYLIRGDNRTMETVFFFFTWRKKHHIICAYVNGFSPSLQVRERLIQTIFHRAGKMALICHMY